MKKPGKRKTGDVEKATPTSIPPAASRPDSPECLLTPSMRLDSSLFTTYLECNAHKALADGSRPVNFFDRVSSLMLALAMLIFLAAVVWFIVFTRQRLREATHSLEAGGAAGEESFLLGDDEK